MVDVVVLSEAQDQLVWKWMPSGTYTARSAYLATFQGSMPCPAWKHTWKAWAPPRVKLFHWLAYQNRCWTADRLANRGLQHHARCLLCDQEPETSTCSSSVHSPSRYGMRPWPGWVSHAGLRRRGRINLHLARHC
jgi:hypothetical protein